jgi:membrane protein
MQKLKAAFGFLKTVFSEWSEDHASRFAAALTLYTVLALGPILLLIVTFVGLAVGQEQARDQIIQQTQSLMGAGGASAVQSVLGNAHPSGSGIPGLVLGFVVLIFSVMGVVGQLQTALNTMWEVEWKKGEGIRGFLRQRLSSLIALVGLLVVLLAIIAGTEFLNGYITTVFSGGGAIWSRIGNELVSFAIFTGLFALIFRVVPQAKIERRDLWIGSLVTAALFMIGKVGIGILLARSSTASYFGSAGFLVLFIIFIYYSAQIFFLGAEFTQVLANRHGTGVSPKKHAQNIPEPPEEYRGGEGAQAERPPDQTETQRSPDQPPRDRPPR